MMHLKTREFKRRSPRKSDIQASIQRIKMKRGWQGREEVPREREQCWKAWRQQKASKVVETE